MLKSCKTNLSNAVKGQMTNLKTQKTGTIECIIYDVSMMLVQPADSHVISIGDAYGILQSLCNNQEPHLVPIASCLTKFQANVLKLVC